MRSPLFRLRTSLGSVRRGGLTQRMEFLTPQLRFPLAPNFNVANDAIARDGKVKKDVTQHWHLGKGTKEDLWRGLAPQPGDCDCGVKYSSLGRTQWGQAIATCAIRAIEGVSGTSERMRNLWETSKSHQRTFEKNRTSSELLQSGEGPLNDLPDWLGRPLNVICESYGTKLKIALRLQKIKSPRTLLNHSTISHPSLENRWNIAYARCCAHNNTVSLDITRTIQ